MTRWLGIDQGHKRIGVAVASDDDAIATPLTFVPAEPLDAAIAKILDLAQEYQARSVVVGWPLNMDDTEGPQAQLARRLAKVIAGAADLDVRLWDERLSSFEADQALAGQLTRGKRRQRQDAIAAAVILQDFLTRGGPDLAPRVEKK